MWKACVKFTQKYLEESYQSVCKESPRWIKFIEYHPSSLDSLIELQLQFGPFCDCHFWDISFTCSTWLLLENQVQWGYQDSSDNSPMTGDIPKNPAQHVFSKQDLNWRKIKIVVPTLALSVTKVSDVNSGWKRKKTTGVKQQGRWYLATSVDRIWSYYCCIGLCILNCT